jgi:ABC-type multidrug transport system fused ATPase/permease subunit
MYFNYKKLLFLFLSIFPILFYFFSLSNNKRRIFLDSLYNQKIEFNNKAFDILENIRIVKYFSTEEEEINNYNKILNDMYINQKNTIKKLNILDLLTNLSFFFGLVFVIKFGINLFKKENIQISNLINFIYYSYYAFKNLSNLII